MTADSNKVKYFFLRNPRLSSNPLSHMRPTNLRILSVIQELGTARRAIKEKGKHVETYLGIRRAATAGTPGRRYGSNT
jgi:hypothetical protein